MSESRHGTPRSSAGEPAGGAAAARGRARRLSLPDGGGAWDGGRDRHARAAGGARGAREMSWSAHMVRLGLSTPPSRAVGEATVGGTVGRTVGDGRPEATVGGTVGRTVGGGGGDGHMGPLGPAADPGALHLRPRSSGRGPPRVPEALARPFLYCLDTSRPSPRTNWTRLVLLPVPQDESLHSDEELLPPRARRASLGGGSAPPLPAAPAPPARRRRRDSAAARPDAAEHVFRRRSRSRRSSTQEAAAEPPPVAPRGAPPPLPALAGDALGPAGRDSARGSERPPAPPLVLIGHAASLTPY